MVEDVSFNAFLRVKLEEGLEVPAVRLPVRPVVRWRVPLLAAASLAVVCGVICWQNWSAYRAQAMDRACAVLDLLEANEGAVVLSENAGNSFAERLLAWQDAPFVEVAGL